MSTKKRPRVVLSCSDTDDADDHVEATSSKKPKITKKKKTIDRGNDKQMSLETCFSKAQKPTGHKKIDQFFAKATDKKPEKNTVSADDFFGSTLTKRDLVKSPKKSPNLTPQKAEPQIVVPETPVTPEQGRKGRTPIKTPNLKKMEVTPEKLFHNSDESKENTPQKSTKKSPMKTPDSARIIDKEVIPKTPKVEGRASFWAFKNREGPMHLGERPIPKARSGLLAGKTFVFSGVLDYIDRDEAQALVEGCGARVTKALSKKTTHLVLGRDPGESKKAKASELGTKQIDENEFFQLFEGIDTASPDKTLTTKRVSPVSLKPSSTISKVKKSDEIMTAKAILKTSRSPSTPQPAQSTFADTGTLSDVTSSLWVDKYRPKARKHLIGQTGDKSSTNRFYTWLANWHRDFRSGAKAKAYSSAPPWAAGSSADEGKWARAVLISGPPGIGKTTSAEVVCAELGFATVEMNASDARSKKLMKEELADSLSTTDISQFAVGKAASLSSTKHALIMDEVDGMSGNQDRGGIQELIQMIKQTKIPVICLCNDRQSPKVRSLANYCLDLRFHRPRVEQIKAAVMSILCKERATIPQSVLNDLIEASNHDIRQVVNSAQLWCTESQLGGADEAAVKSSTVRKDLHLGPFEVIRKVFQPDMSGLEGKPASFAQSMDLFFMDYELGPLFVQENYLKSHNTVSPRNVKPGDKFGHLDLLAQAAKDIGTGDMISQTIRRAGTGSWSLLPVQSVFASVAPGRLLRGPLPGGPGGVSFPGWFGRNSTSGKNRRLAGQLSSHLRLATQGGAASPNALLLDYLSPMAECWAQLLKEGDIQSVLDQLIDYKLLREDFDSIMELTSWPGKPSHMAGVDSKVKAGLTRAYNKSALMLPYAPGTGITSGRKTAKEDPQMDDEDAGLFDGDDEDEAETKDDLDLDALIVKQKASDKRKTAHETGGAGPAKKTKKAAAAPAKTRGGKAKK